MILKVPDQVKRNTTPLLQGTKWTSPISMELSQSSDMKSKKEAKDTGNHITMTQCTTEMSLTLTSFRKGILILWCQPTLLGTTKTNPTKSVLLKAVIHTPCLQRESTLNLWRRHLKRMTFRVVKPTHQVLVPSTQEKDEAGYKQTSLTIFQELRQALSRKVLQPSDRLTHCNQITSSLAVMNS